MPGMRTAAIIAFSVAVTEASAMMIFAGLSSAALRWICSVLATSSAPSEVSAWRWA